jgi:SRSO17 transposase
LCSNGGLRRCRHDQKATCDSVPAPLEGYAIRLDDLFRARAQREGFRRCLEGLLLPAERNKTLTALANTEPLAGAQRREAQSLQWFLSESGWDPEEINERRLEPFNLRDCDPADIR